MAMFGEALRIDHALISALAAPTVATATHDAYLEAMGR